MRVGHAAGLRQRLAIAFAGVALATTVVVMALTFLISLYLVTSGATVVPPSLRSWVQRHLAHPGLGSIVAYAVLATIILGLTVAAISSFATRRALSPLRQLTEAAQQLAGGDLSVRLEAAGHDELTELVERFNEMATSLEQTIMELRLLGTRARQFAGDVSHELRTPLAAMTAVTDVLDEHALAVTDRSGQAARLVSQEIHHLNRLVEALIEISRFDAGTAQLVVDDVDVGTALQQSLKARGWSDEVVTDVQSGLRCVIDPRRFDVIVANLIGNALRHGSPPVAVRIWSDQPGQDKLLHIEVRDHGEGIAEDALPLVFNRFFKADSARGRSDGSGLGLAIAWENARLHGGTISAANQAGGGAVFAATLAVLPHESFYRSGPMPNEPSSDVDSTGPPASGPEA
jgi:two-component system, OmpR family, sensor histidine kinase MtrB